MLLKLIPTGTTIRFVRLRKFYFAFSLLMLALAGVSFFAQGLNFGIDFEGGILMEVRVQGQEQADVNAIRGRLLALPIGDVSVQRFGQPTDVLIRVVRQPGGDEAQQVAIAQIQDALGDSVDYRRIEAVGPTVGEELIWDGTMAVLLALLAIMIYVWFRFEWQFGLAAVIALAHDVALTIGLFSELELEFNLATVAAVLTIAGYSINDTVVVFDRVRENLRKYKKMPLSDLMDRSLNDTLTRTLLTSVTTMLAIAALYVFGGQVIRDFAIALGWGVIIGTYSSICVAVPLLLMIGIKRATFTGDEESGPAEQPAKS